MAFFDRLQSETEQARAHVTGAPVIQAIREGRFDLEGYTWFLTQAYHHVKHTVPLMMACGARLPDRLRWLQPRLKDYIDEEIGHEQWILEDLAECGVDPAAVARSSPGFEVEQLVSYVYDFINRRNPVGFLGMVYVLEGTSTELATETARLAQAKLGLPNRAFRYLLSHGELDREHVQFFRDLVNELSDPDDVDAVVHVAGRVYRLYGDIIRSARGEALDHAA